MGHGNPIGADHHEQDYRQAAPLMALSGFSASNHPQQTGKREPGEPLFEVEGRRDVTNEVDDRGTDPAFIRTLVERFGEFTLDVAASAHNTKAGSYFTRQDDGLAQLWRGNVWCNPPYSDCGAWVRKAWDEWERRPHRDYPVRRIVMLLPANRVEQKWWQEHVEPYRDRTDSPLRVEFLPGRMRFIRPDWTPGPKGDRPPFGCCLLIWGDHA